MRRGRSWPLSCPGRYIVRLPLCRRGRQQRLFCPQPECLRSCWPALHALRDVDRAGEVHEPIEFLLPCLPAETLVRSVACDAITNRGSGYIAMASPRFPIRQCRTITVAPEALRSRYSLAPRVGVDADTAVPRHEPAVVRTGRFAQFGVGTDLQRRSMRPVQSTKPSRLTDGLPFTTFDV